MLSNVQAFLDKERAYATRPAYEPEAKTTMLTKATRFQNVKLQTKAVVLQPRVLFTHIVVSVTNNKNPPEEWYQNIDLERNIVRYLYQNLASKTKKDYRIDMKNYTFYCDFRELRFAFFVNVFNLLI